MSSDSILLLTVESLACIPLEMLHHLWPHSTTARRAAMLLRQEALLCGMSVGSAGAAPGHLGTATLPSPSSSGFSRKIGQRRADRAPPHGARGEPPAVSALLPSRSIAYETEGKLEQGGGPSISSTGTSERPVLSRSAVYTGRLAARRLLGRAPALSICAAFVPHDLW